MPDVTREDLAALVQQLEAEHFPYNEKGQAAHRAYKAIASTLETGETLRVAAEAYSREEFERDRHGETGERNARARRTRAKDEAALETEEIRRV
jgi:hypothetical protein